MAVLAVAAAGAVLLLVLTFRPVVQGDGVGYFSYLHAVMVRHSLDLGPEYAAASAAGVNSNPAQLQAPTRTGHLANFFSVGPPLLAAPAYLVALLLAGPAPSPYAPALVGAYVLSSLLLGLVALLFCWSMTRSPAAVAATALGTPFAFYLLYEPSYSHTFSAFCVAAFVWVWWRGREARSALGWVALGALAGLMTVTRWQDGVLAAIALLTPPPAGARWRPLLAAPGAALALAPQLVVDQVIFGTWMPQRPPGQDLDPLSGHQLQVLLSSWHGLFTWHPLTAVAAAGFLLVRDARLRIACVYALLAQTLINGSAPDWWGGAAFGARRFLDLLPFWAIGLAALASRLPAALAWLATGAAAVWNALLVANLRYVIRGDHDPGLLGLVTGQLAAVEHLPRLVAQGAVVRDLALWPLAGGRPDPAAGLGWLAAEAAAVALVVLLLLASSLRPSAVWRRPGLAVATTRPLPLEAGANPGPGKRSRS